MKRASFMFFDNGPRSYILRRFTMTDYNQLSNEELLQFYRNALENYSGAIGHQKSLRNENAAKVYAEILKERGQTVPNSCEGKGVYNGVGSS